MANTTFQVPKAHIAMAICLPLAVLLGYVLAEPLESGSIAVVVFVLVLLAVPVMLKWHHPILIFCWNAAIYPIFLPSRSASKAMSYANEYTASGERLGLANQSSGLRPKPMNSM